MIYTLNAEKTVDLKAALEAARDEFLMTSHAFGGPAHVERLVALRRGTDADLTKAKAKVPGALEEDEVQAGHDAEHGRIVAARKAKLAEDPRAKQIVAAVDRAIEAAILLAGGAPVSCTIQGSFDDPRVPPRASVSVDF